MLVLDIIITNIYEEIMNECKYEDKIETMASDIKEIKSDTKNLLKFKWQIMGGSAILVISITLLVSVLSLFK